MRALGISLVCLAFLPAQIATGAKTITVGKGGGYNHMTIQAGIDAATTGDMVVVYPGTYVENIRFRGNNITLRSSNPVDTATVAATVIDGNSTGSVVTFEGDETSSCVLSGFMIRNGYAKQGGGIFGSHTRATIRGNIIAYNRAFDVYVIGWLSNPDTERASAKSKTQAETNPDGLLSHFWIPLGKGGGLYLCHGLIENNTIANNTANESGAGLYECGGTIQYNTVTFNGGSALSGCGGMIQNNTIAGNEGSGLIYCGGTIQSNNISSNHWYAGAGLNWCPGMIQGNTITGNFASEGGGLYWCNGTIQDNTIADNHAEVNGGGLYMCDGMIQNNKIVGNFGHYGGGLNDCNGTIRNNLIAQNAETSIYPSPSYGGGFYSCDGLILSNTIVGNSSGFGGGLYLCRGLIVNCIIWANTATTGPAQLNYSSKPKYSCIEGWTGDGSGNINADPRFVDPDGLDNNPNTYEDNNYHLFAGSPCVNSGTNYYFYGWPIHDLDGNVRVVGRVTDMGCYELGSTPDSDGDLLSNADEATSRTNPNNPDTDGDGLADGVEVILGSDPLVARQPRVSHVPADSPTIQAAIWMSAPGDGWIVSPGLYQENIHFLGKDITLRSSASGSSPMVLATVIDGNQSGPVVSFDGAETSSCLLSGFTLTNGCADQGGGIRGNATCARIENNWIVDNAATDEGGGISRCHGTIQDNVVTSNSAYNDGGGLRDCDGAIEGNIIANNTAFVYGGGGLSGCDGIVRSNTISGNWAEWKGGGLSECNGTIEWNTISNNSTGVYGGGLAECGGLIQGNTIVGNSADGLMVWSSQVLPGGHGGGLSQCYGIIQNNIISGNFASSIGGGVHYCGMVRNNIIAGNSSAWVGGGVGSANGAIENNTIAFNWASNGGGVAACGGTTISSCIIWANSADTSQSQIYDSVAPRYSCIQGWTGGGIGNISADPLFAAPPASNPSTRDAPGYFLSLNSPCIDAGDPSPQQNDGCRPPGLKTERNDMGAFGGPNNGGWPAALYPWPDLTGTLLSVEPQPIVAGQAIALSGSIVNQGDLPSFSQVWVEFWAINQATGWRGLLCESLLLQPMGVGEAFRLADIAPQRVAYAGIPTEFYTIEMRIDVTNTVAERDEANNVLRWQRAQVLSDRPNLTVIGFNFSPQDVKPAGGNSISFAGSILNDGLRATTASFWVEMRVWPTLPFQATGRYLCDSLLVAQPLAPGQSVDLGILTTKASPLPPGVYFVGIILDATRAIAEQREDDNVAWATGKRLYVGPRPTSARNWKQYW